MKVDTAVLVIACPPYPGANVTAVLQEELIAVVRAEAVRRGTTVPAAETDLLLLPTFIDSLTVVELLCAVDDVLPFEVTECVVRAGGYRSIGSAVKHLVERIETKWISHHKGVKV